jgi:T3SS negative regulator,GrlR
MKNGLYSITAKGFDGVEWPPGGVIVLRNGVLLGGSSFMYYIGSYSTKDGVFKGECVLNAHTPPPPSHLYFNAKDIGAGFTGTYEGDRAELTATVLLRKRCLTLQVTLRKLADIDGTCDRLTSQRGALASPTC